MSPAQISVVIGSQNARHTICDCLGTIKRQLEGKEAEIVVADSSTDGTAELIEKDFPEVTLIKAASDSLVPHLWGIGMDRATGPIVAITTGHCIPEPQWIENILQAAQSHAQFDGFGGPIGAPITGSAKDWAIYFSRFSAFMPPVTNGPTKDIPGDNAAYRKDALDRCWADREKGFWETLFHDALRADGKQLYMSEDVEVRLGNGGKALDYFGIRFKHGFHYGSTRPNNKGLIRIVRICAAPVLMPYLVLRMGKRIGQRKPEWLSRYILCLPWLVFFTTAWSLGEISGYLKSGNLQSGNNELA